MCLRQLLSRRRVLIVTISTLLCTGCATMQSSWRTIVNSMTPDSGYYDDDTDSDDDSWISEAGVEANRDGMREKDPDPLRKYLSSPKAMSIERNLGVE